MSVKNLSQRLSAAREAAESRGDTFYPGPSRIHLASFPPKERWDDWVELDSRAWPERKEKRYASAHEALEDVRRLWGALGRPPGLSGQVAQ